MLKTFPFILEIPAFFLFLYFINITLFPEFPAFLGRDPHPYWIVIFMFGMKYGVNAGLMSGIVAAGAYLGLIWKDGDRTLFEDLSFYYLPCLFIVAGALIGYVITRKRLQRLAVEMERDHLISSQKQIEFQNATLSDINRELEKKVVSRMTTLVTLYEGAKRLEEPDLATLYRSIIEFIAKTLEVNGVILFVRSEGGWKLKEKIGDVGNMPEQLRINEGLVGMAGTSGKIVTARDLIDATESASDYQCVMAGPIKDLKGDVPIVICIHYLPITKLNSATLNLFAFLLQWAGRAVKRSAYIDELKSGEIMDSQYPVYSHHYSLTRLKQEFLRSKKYYLPLSVGQLKVDGADRLDESRRRHLFLAIATLLKNATRDVDIVAYNNDVHYPFIVLMMTASENQAGEIKDAIFKDIQKIRLGEEMGVRFSMNISSFNPRMEDFQDLLHK